VVRDREIIDALVEPTHRGPSPELGRALAGWPGFHYWAPGDGLGRLVLIRALGARVRERWWLHGLLFVVTFATVAAGGALLAGTPAATAAWPQALTLEALRAAFEGWLGALAPGVDFAMALMGVLLTHECGHYFVAKRYLINASPPYFLPAPPWWNFIGTFGAFIRLRSPIVDRQQLMDVGAAGPWAGFVVALTLLLVGLTRSQVVPDAAHDFPFVVFFLGNAVPLGDCLVTWAARIWLLGEGTIVLHPLALAGWVGVFVTMLNLLPLGQLDGGHILYAMVGERQKLIAKLAWLALIPLGIGFKGWWVWAALILLLSRGRIAHPSVLDRFRSIPASRRWLGWGTLALFVVTFTPVPFYI
jgi:membrane-associated protease RseP (regulator of RpoE activity)